MTTSIDDDIRCDASQPEVGGDAPLERFRRLTACIHTLQPFAVQGLSRDTRQPDFLATECHNGIEPAIDRNDHDVLILPSPTESLGEQVSNFNRQRSAAMLPEQFSTCGDVVASKAFDESSDEKARSVTFERGKLLASALVRWLTRIERREDVIHQEGHIVLSNVILYERPHPPCRSIDDTEASQRMPEGLRDVRLTIDEVARSRGIEMEVLPLAAAHPPGVDVGLEQRVEDFLVACGGVEDVLLYGLCQMRECEQPAASFHPDNS